MRGDDSKAASLLSKSQDDSIKKLNNSALLMERAGNTEEALAKYREARRRLCALPCCCCSRTRTRSTGLHAKDAIAPATSAALSLSRSGNACAHAAQATSSRDRQRRARRQKGGARPVRIAHL